MTTSTQKWRGREKAFYSRMASKMNSAWASFFLRSLVPARDEFVRNPTPINAEEYLRQIKIVWKKDREYNWGLAETCSAFMNELKLVKSQLEQKEVQKLLGSILGDISSK